MPGRRSIRFLLAFAALLTLSVAAPSGAGAAAGGREGQRADGDRGRHAVHARVGVGRSRAISRRGRASDTSALAVVTRSPAPGGVLSGSVDWEVGVSGGGVDRVEFLIDGERRWTEQSWPWQFGGTASGLDTRKLANGGHVLTAVAYGGRRVRSGRSSVEIKVENPVPDSPSPDTELVFSDDFEGAAGTLPNSGKWTAMNWCDRWGSLSCNTNRTKNVALDGQGNVRIRAIRESYVDPYGNTGSWTAGRLETQSKFSFTYGTIMARIKVPAGRGLWPSFWTTSATKTGWPSTGEIDVMELLGHDPATYYCSVHGASGGTHVPETIGYDAPASLSADFHVYEARWTPTKVDFLLDGKPCGTISTSSLTPFAPQQLLVGMAVGGSWPGSPDSSTPSTADMLVDWVRAYQ